MKGLLTIPELPEVETIRSELKPWLTNRTINSVKFVDATPSKKYANLSKAKGKRILTVNRRGKFLLLPLDGENELVIHLGMTGVITPNKPKKHLRIKLKLSEGENSHLYFQDTRRFGRFLVVTKNHYQDLPTLNNMGPEPFSKEFNDPQFAKALQNSKVAIKTYLLSQKPVAGLGNIYADEALWHAKIHPLTPAEQIPQENIPSLRLAIIDILLASLNAKGTTLSDYRTVNGQIGNYSEALNVYGKKSEPCPNCTVEIAKIFVAGRGTHFCPNCQQKLA